MGGGGSQSSSGVQDTALSTQQAKILKQREEQYQEHFFPEMLNMLAESKDESTTGAMMAPQASAINQSANAAKREFSTAAAQRGISGSGVELQGLAGINNASRSMLADAYYQSKQAQIQQRNTIMQMAGAMSPTPTTAAPVGQSSSSSSAQGGL